MYQTELSRSIIFEPGREHYEQPPGVNFDENLHEAQAWELIQHNRYPQLIDIDHSDTEAQEQDPLTVEMVFSEFSHAVLFESADELLNTVPGTPRFDLVLDKVKSEITLHHLWRMGLPSELSKFLNLDDPETRTLLTDEYEKIPEETRRDNSSNSFEVRIGKVLEHIYKQHPKEKVQDTLDIWRDDLRIRQEVADGKYKKRAPTELQRDTFLQRYLQEEHSAHDLVLKIGNTLLSATQPEIVEFRNSLDRLPVDHANEAHISRLQILRTFIDTEFIATPSSS